MAVYLHLRTWKNKLLHNCHLNSVKPGRGGGLNLSVVVVITSGCKSQVTQRRSLEATKPKNLPYKISRRELWT